jgi:uncharacterized protein
MPAVRSANGCAHREQQGERYKIALWPWVQEIIHVAFRRSNLYLSPDMYLPNLPGMDDYLRAANGFMQDQMLFGTAFPFCPLKPNTDWFLTYPWKPEALEKVLRGNAEKLLGIGGSVRV